MRYLDLFLVIAGLASGQTPAASVVGWAVDTSGAVIPGVAVNVVQLETNQAFTKVTDAAGDSTVLYLAPGKYISEAKRPGFRAHKQAKFVLLVNQTLRFDVQMEVGATTESVTVADTPTPLTTERGARGDVTTNHELTEKPLAGRKFSELAFLNGGVLQKGEDGDGAYAINGSRADNVGFLLDGMNNTQRRNTGSRANTPLEGVLEFKMITSGFSAAYGRYAGGILSVVLTSGGNKLRGSRCEFLRNDELDARGFLAVTKPKLRRNQLGATVSGSIIKNRTFFLFSWEALRQVSGSLQRAGRVRKAAWDYGSPQSGSPVCGEPDSGGEIGSRGAEAGELPPSPQLGFSGGKLHWPSEMHE